MPNRPVASPQLADLGEDRLVSSVVTSYGPPPAFVRIGPGDDAAVIDLAGPVVVSTDTLVEGFDFRHDWSDGFDVGVKTAAQNLADIAAMGAQPRALVVSLAAPGDLAAQWATELARGLDDECRRAGAHVVGGDVSAAAEIVVTGTALGVLPGPAVRRDGARVGDVVALAGRTGPSGAGLALLAAGHRAAGYRAAGYGAAAGDAEGSVPGPVVAALLAAHRAPRPPYEAGPQAAAAGAHALIDTSDGLLRDAARVGAASGVILDLDPDALAPQADLVEAAELLGAPEAAREWVLTGGEDHALLACFPAGAALPPAYRAVGRVVDRRAAAGATDAAGTPLAVLVGGRPWTGVTGWMHFRDR